MRADDLVALVDELASLGRTLDLSEPSFVQGAIGDVQDAKVTWDQRRDNWEPAFTRYEFASGEIIYNPDLGNQYFLLVYLHRCVPVEMIRERLRSPEFMQPASRTTIALYTDTPYVVRPLNAFTYYDNGSGCVTSFGLAQ